jgi:hypothetical protein
MHTTHVSCTFGLRYPAPIDDLYELNVALNVNFWTRRGRREKESPGGGVVPRGVGGELGSGADAQLNVD